MPDPARAHPFSDNTPVFHLAATFLVWYELKSNAVQEALLSCLVVSNLQSIEKAEDVNATLLQQGFLLLNSGKE